MFFNFLKTSLLSNSIKYSTFFDLKIVMITSQPSLTDSITLLLPLLGSFLHQIFHSDAN